MKAQAAVAEREEFKGNVAFVGTKDYYRGPEESPSRQGYHWNSNAETYFLIGDGMGKAMRAMLEERARAAGAAGNADEERALLRGGAEAVAPPGDYAPGCLPDTSWGARPGAAGGGRLAALLMLAALVCVSLRAHRRPLRAGKRKP
jgi:hypothetical protein